MPQFNPDDAALSNHGVPKRLLEIVDRALPALQPGEFPAVVFQKLSAINFPRQFSGVFDSGQLFTGTELGPLRTAVQQFKHKITAATGIEFTGIPLLRYYRDGKDHTSWRQGISELYAGAPEILIVGFGETRVLDIRLKLDHDEIFSLPLQEGTVVHLRQPLREQWELQ